MTDQPLSTTARLTEEITALRRWLEEAALPLWWEAGAAKPDGGFHERVGQDGRPILGDDRRARVQPRQAYCYAAAGENGWGGDWKRALDQGLSWFDRVYRLESGLYGNLANASGKLIDPSFDLYNQAFALFAAAQTAKVLPERKGEMRERALLILSLLKAQYAHPVQGFEEDNPPRYPLCSNPHMHLFEAMLAWEKVDPSGPWTAVADEIADLAMTASSIRAMVACESFSIRTGCRLLVRTAVSWSPATNSNGRGFSPVGGFCATVSMRVKAAKRLFEIAESHGICPRRKSRRHELARRFLAA